MDLDDASGETNSNESAADDAGGRPATNAPASAVIRDGVRDLILQGNLDPGQRIGQEALAERFDVSRIPVREALRQLESEGLVTLIPHSGARVARLDYDDCLELYRMREALEPVILGQSVKHMEDEDVEALADLARAVEAAADDPEHWLAADRSFHLQSYACARMKRGEKLAEGFWNQTQQYRRAYIYALPERSVRLEVVYLEHRLIVDAAERRDSEDAAARLHSHIRRTRIELSKHADVLQTPSPAQS